MEKVVGAFEARRQFGKLLNDVNGKGDRIVVERHGEAIAAVVPMSVYRQWQQQRAAFFDQMRAIAERVDLTPEQAETEATAAVRSVRSVRAVRDQQ